MDRQPFAFERYQNTSIAQDGFMGKIGGAVRAVGGAIAKGARAIGEAASPGGEVGDPFHNPPAIPDPKPAKDAEPAALAGAPVAQDCWKSFAKKYHAGGKLSA